MQNIAALIISPYCDNNCLFCGSSPQISDIEIKKLESDLEQNITYHLNAGFKRIELSGCDPGEYRDINNLLKYLKEKGFEYIFLSTNGNRFSDYELAKELVLNGLDAVKIPLYGSTAEIHDSVTRKKNSFNQAVNAIKNFKKLGIDVKINSLIMKHNKFDLINLFKLMSGFTQWKNCFFSVPCLSQFSMPESFYLPIKELNEYILPLIYYGMINEIFPQFTEIPLCSIGFNYPYILKSGIPPRGIQQPPEHFKSDQKDIPNYRVKKKIEMCKKCSVEDKCDGFFANDVDRYGSGDLKPL